VFLRISFWVWLLDWGLVMMTQPMLQCWQHSLQRGYYRLNVDCVEESNCCCYKCCCKRFPFLQWAFEENVPRQILRHTLLELVLPADDVVNAAVVAVEEAAVAVEHSNLAEEAVLHNKIVVEAVAVVVAAAADSPFQNCYLDPSSLPHRVAAVEVPFPVEVDDSVHWYWLVPFFYQL
jgi:hypothetical protein